MQETNVQRQHVIIIFCFVHCELDQFLVLDHLMERPNGTNEAFTFFETGFLGR